MRIVRYFSICWQRACVLGIVLAAVYPLGAQETVNYEGIPGTATRSTVINFTQLAEQQAPQPPAIDTPSVVIPLTPMRDLPAVNWDQVVAIDDTLRTTASHGSTPAPCTPAPADTFLGLDDPTGQNGPFCGESDCTDLMDNDNDGQIDESLAPIPPDTHGAAGPNHLMTVLNTEVRIQNKSGGVISTVTLASFWSAVGNPAAFDPKVVYDPFQGRWIFTATANTGLATSALLIASSQTSDPTQNWNLFSVDVDASNLVWADYPTIGFNQHWVAVNVLMVNIASGLFTTSDTFIFNKANLYASPASATFSRFQLNAVTDGLVQAPAITYDNNINELWALQSYNGNDASGFGFLRLFAITNTPNPCTTANPCFTAVGFIATNQRWDPAIADNNADTFPDDIAPQCGTTAATQTNDQRIQNVVYRNGDLWSTHMVYLPPGNPGQNGNPNRTSVQWWEITPSLIPANISVLQRALIDDTNAQFHYSFPTISANQNDDVVLGYSIHHPTQFISAAYSYREHNDTASTLRPPFVYKTGEAPYFKNYGQPRNRWGDYSHTVIDPSNDTDFWTIQEYADTPQNWSVPASGPDRWATQWAVIGPAAATTCPANFDWAQVSLNSPNGVTFSGSGHDMVFDSGRNLIVMFGSDPFVSSNTYTWEWDGCTWMARSPANSPAARVFHCMAYDSQRAKTVLFGGWDQCVNFPIENTYGDTWEYNGSNWTQVSSGGANDPPARLGAALAYDANRNVTVLFGGSRNLGCDAQITFSDTWEYNGSQWTQKFPANNPPESDRHVMAYDPVNQLILLYTGTETWEYNGTNWTQQFPNNNPGFRSQHDMAFDAARGKIVLYGGFMDQQLWEWDGLDWSQITGASAGNSQRNPAMAYDLARGELVMFEGVPDPPGNSEPETYVINNSTQSFCLSGNATGTGWSWCITGAGFEVCDLNVPGVANGSPPSALAAQFVSSIDNAGCSGVDATVVNTTPQCFNVTVAGGEDFNLLVGQAAQSPNCCMTANTNCSFNPDIFRVELAGADCNGNATDDAVDIEGGASSDINGNGVPDECECPGDVDGDDDVDVTDLLDLLASWGECPGCAADLDGDGSVGVLDLLALLATWGAC